MKIEITDEELHNISAVIVLASQSPEADKVNWEVISKLLAKLDRP
jgi:hypothetical protein